MSQLVFDEQAARQIEAIDVGCGPGFYCAELLDEVGDSGAVVGFDGSPAMLALAARRCAGSDNVEFVEADATSLPVEDESFDAAISVQVQEYVPDVATSLGELYRCLRPGGRVLVFDIDWATLSVHADDPELTRRVLGAWDEHLAHRSLPRTLAPRLRSAGFTAVRVDAHAFATTDFDADSYGSALVPFIGDFVAGRAGITGEEAAAWVAEQRELGRQGEFYFAITQFCVTASKPDCGSILAAS